LLRVGDFDVIFIQREAMPLGPAWFERLVSVNKLPIIFDFDDAIYLPNVSDANRWILWLKRPSKTAAIIRLSSQVIVGNEVLRRYAVQFNENVTVIPTPIDTDFYTVRSEVERSHKPITIGWVGSNSTVQYLHQLDSVFKELASRYTFQVRVIGGQYDLAGVDVSCQPWSLENELTDLHSFDVGVMPMPDNDWTRGKCGFKALQYMGVGVPAVVSPVGVNRQIINHGENGFLASTEDEWMTCLTRLVEDPSLRCHLGKAGRKTVEDRYSVKLNAPKLLEIIHSAAATPK
jgi:glycosyltransferase involved in cell wall biosynthesis